MVFVIHRCKDTNYFRKLQISDDLFFRHKGHKGVWHLCVKLGNSPRTNRDFLFSVCREYPIFAPSKVILNVYDYETDSIFIQVTSVGDNDGMDVDESGPEI